MYSQQDLFKQLFGEYAHYFNEGFHFWFEKMDNEKNYSAIKDKTEDYAFFKFWINKSIPTLTWNILEDQSEEAKELRILLKN